jgi:hypothetical protein
VQTAGSLVVSALSIALRTFAALPPPPDDDEPHAPAASASGSARELTQILPRRERTRPR